MEGGAESYRGDECSPDEQAAVKSWHKIGNRAHDVVVREVDFKGDVPEEPCHSIGDAQPVRADEKPEDNRQAESDFQYKFAVKPYLLVLEVADAEDAADQC